MKGLPGFGSAAFRSMSTPGRPRTQRDRDAIEIDGAVHGPDRPGRGPAADPQGVLAYLGGLPAIRFTADFLAFDTDCQTGKVTGTLDAADRPVRATRRCRMPWKRPASRSPISDCCGSRWTSNDRVSAAAVPRIRRPR